MYKYKLISKNNKNKKITKIDLKIIMIVIMNLIIVN